MGHKNELMIPNYYCDEGEPEMIPNPDYQPDKSFYICECGSDDAKQRSDRYGIYYGIYCDSCFENSYKQDSEYDYFDAGEYLEPEDY